MKMYLVLHIRTVPSNSSIVITLKEPRDNIFDGLSEFVPWKKSGESDNKEQHIDLYEMWLSGRVVQLRSTNTGIHFAILCS